MQVPEHFAIPIPDGLPFEQAVVLPLACDTASAGLFTTLGLSTPPNKANQIVLIWGGSSSVGCCAIQLAHAAGYTVFTTASKRNHDLCRSLGASQVFDHSHDNVEEEVIKAMQGEVAGALDCIASESTISSCVRILSSGHKVATVLTPPEHAAKDGVEVQRCKLLFQFQTILTSHSEHPFLLGQFGVRGRPLLDRESSSRRYATAKARCTGDRRGIGKHSGCDRCSQKRCQRDQNRGQTVSSLVVSKQGNPTEERQVFHGDILSKFHSSRGR